MRCARCGTEFEGNFCPSCGLAATEETSPLPEICGRCGTSFTGRFCPNCGWPSGRPYPPERRPSGFRALLGGLWVVTLVIFMAYLAAVLIAIILISPMVVSGILSGSCDDCLAAIFVVNPFSERLFHVLLLSGQNFLLWFTILLSLLVGIYLYLGLFHGRSTYRAIRLPLWKVRERLRSRSTIVAVGQIFAAILFFDLVYFSLFLPSVGIQAEAPESLRNLPEWYLMYIFVEAAFTEEVATRVALIGVPLVLGSFAIRLFRTFSSPVANPGGARFVAGSLKYLLGGQVGPASPRAAQALGAVLVVLSASFFGYLHVVSWGVLWKFVDTFVGGLALGYLFLRKGLAASILLHFSINAFSILITAAGGEENFAALLMIVLFYYGLVALGAGFFAFYVREVGKFLLKPFLKPSMRVTAGRPPGYGTPPGAPEATLFSVACPNCGSREAVYVEGVLNCAVCGKRL